MNFKVYFLLIIAFISGLAAKAANTPPTFVGGTNQSLITCPGTASTIDSFLITNDPDVGQNLTWAIFKGPSHGTLHGFSGSGTSNGGNVAPTGFSYNSNVGFTGIDSFVISVNDGFATSYTKVSVFIQSGPTLSPVSGNTSLCVGNTSQLTDTAKGGTWSSSNTAVARVNTSGLVTAVAAGTATISYSATSGSGCTSVATSAVTVYAIPTVANITGTNTVCVGSTTQFSDNTAGGIWSSSNTNNATVDQTGLVSGITGSNNGNTATITYTVTNGTSCSTAVTRNVTVYAIPTVAAITGKTDICTGNTSTLADATNGGTWSSLNTAIAVVSANGGVVTGVAVGIDTIRYTVTNAPNRGGCSNYSDTIVNISTAPTVAAIKGTTKNICVGKTTTLTDATAGGIWTSSNVALAKVDSTTGVVTAVSAGAPTIRYTVSNAGGCSTQVTYAITVNNNPTVAAIVGSNTTCVNATLSLTDNTANGVWSSTNISIAKVDTVGNVTGVKAGTDTIAYTLTSAAGCVTSSILPISIVTGISVKPIYGVSVLCSGNSTVLQDSTAGGTWTSSDYGVAFPQGSTVYAGSGGTAVITYTVSGGTGCSGSTTFNFTVIQVPSVPAINGSSQVCVGSSTQLTNSVSGGFWTSSNTSLATVDQTGLVKGISAGGPVISYTVTGNGGCTQTSTFNINVNALPTVKKLVGSNSTCVGATSIYTDSTAGGVWKSSNTSVATISVNGIFQTKSAGTTEVSYTVTNGNQCSVADSISVDVNQFLVVSPIMGADSVCQTFTTILTDSTTGGTWVSRNTTIATLVTANNVTTVTGVAAGSVYIIDSLSNGGCIGKDSILITVNARPAAPTIQGSPNGGNICAGGTNTFTGNPTGGVWTSSNTAAASIVSTSGFTTGIATGTTTISYTVSNAAGCTRSATSNLNVIAAGQALPAIGGSGSVCVGSNITLTNTTTGGTWNSSNTAVATVNATSGVVTGISAGSATIEYSAGGGGGAFGCPRTANKVITINAQPPVTSIIGNTSVCANGYMLLSDNTGGGAWSSYHTTIANVDANGIVSGVAAGKDTIAYTVTDGTTGCTNTAYSLISVNALPIIAKITGTTSICIGKNSTLTDATLNGVWGTTNSTITSVSSGGLVTGLSVGTDSIYYKVTNANKCSDSVVAAFNVNGLPVIAAITGATPMCVGTNATLSSTTLGGTWKSTNPVVASISASGFVQALTAGTTTITYIVTNISGCSDSVSTNITVNPLPVIGKITGTTSICLGKTTILSDTTAGGNLFNANPSVATYTTINSASIQVTGVSVGTDKFTYVVTNVYGCVDSVSATILVNSLPTIAQVQGATTACVSKTAQLTNATAGGTWVSANKSIATVNASGLVLGVKAGTDTIKYIVTNIAGCTDSVNTVVTINPLPVIGVISGANPICVNATIQLSDTSLNGIWSSVNNFATINASGLVTGVSAGTGIVRYTVTNVYGCVDSVSSSFTVNPLPVIAAIGGSKGICFGKTTQLSETTTGGIWKSVSTSVASIDVNGLVTANQVGTTVIRYIVTNGNGCTDSVSATVTVNALPVIASIGGNTTICAHNTTQLTEATNNGTWKSVTTNVATVNSIGLVAGINPGSTIIRYTVTNSNGCVDSTATTVTVNALPVINSITGTTTLCAGKTTQLSEFTQSGIWKSATPSVATIDLNGLVTGVKAGTDSIRYIVTNGNGCIDSVASVVKVNALPVLSTILGATSICMGKTSQLSDTTSGGNWVSIYPGVATVNTTGLVSTVSTGSGIIRYIVTNTNGCTDSVSATVSVNALPLIASISGTTTICSGKTTQLTETTNGGIWKSVTPSVALVNATGLVTGVNAGSSVIRYTVTNGSGCTDSVATTVIINALPVFTQITGNTSICAGKTTQLIETTTGGTWNSISPSVATVDVNGLVNAVKSGTSIIRYSVTNGNGCTDSVAATVTVNALPVIAAINGTTTICAGKTSQLTETTTGGIWKSITPAFVTVNSTGLITGIAAGSSVLRYTVTNGSGCTDSVSTSVTINALPIIAAISGATTLCASKTTQLIETTSGGTWNSITPSVATVDLNGLVTASSAGTSIIRYTVTNGNGCTDSVSSTVTVNALPVLSAITGSTSFCANKSNQLSDTAVGGIWSSSNINVATNNNSGLFTAVAPGTFTAIYTLTNGNGCTSSVSVVDTINAVPTVSAITGNSSVCSGSSITLSAITNGTGVWSSLTPFTATVGANTGIVTGGNFAGGTTIKYVVSNSFGCQDSVSKVITVNATPVVASISGISSTCVGSTLNLTNTTPAGKWTLTNNSIATIDSVLGTVNALAAGTDTVIYTVTNGSGCSASVNASFAINIVPSITTIGSNTPVNAGDTLYLTSVSSVQGVVYSWTGPNGFTASSQNPYVANTVAASAGNYYVNANNNGCISTLDSVSVVINVSYLVSGTILSPKGFPVNIASVNVSGTSTKSTLTDASGNFSVMLGSGANTSYVLAPYKNNDVVKANGVTTLDVALIQSHILQKSILNSPYKILAADVNGDGKVSTLDIVFIKRLIL